MAWNPARPSTIQRIQLVYKLVERCNLNCSYCYYYNMGDDTALGRPALASLECSQAMAQWLAEGCKALDIPEVLISFHGGEPMLMRSHEFAETCDRFVRTLAPVAKVSFSIQTNGTLLTEGWLEALKGYRVSVGISIDGDRKDNDRYRLDHQNQSSFDKTEAFIKRIVRESETHPQLSPSTISVLNPLIDYKNTYKYLRSIGVKSMHFLLPDRSRDDCHAGFECEAIAMGNGLLDIFHAWLTEDDPDINVRFINEKLGFFDLSEYTANTTSQRKRNQILVGRTDGTVTLDDSLMPALPLYQEMPAFSVTDCSMQQAFSHPVFMALEEQKNTLPDDCQSCAWASLCRGGDLENRFSRDRGFNNPSCYCSAYKILYQGMCNFLVNSGYPASEIESRFGVAQQCMTSAG